MRASARLSVGAISDADLAIYSQVLPQQSLLLDAQQAIAWERLEEKLKGYYSSSNEGQPEYPPLILLKLELLCHLYHMGREKVLERACSDLHWKFFLGLPIRASLPDQSTLCVFRKRLGADGFKKIFDSLIAMAREEGLISDRLRLKDATHLYADIAVPTSLGLFAQLRERMLKAIRQFDPEAADAFGLDLERMRERTEATHPEERLAARVEMVQDLLAWIRQQPQSPKDASPRKRWQAIQAIGDLAEKILLDLSHPQAGNKTLSVADPDARRGKHGEYYEGYLLDVMMDSESELVTGLNVLPANGDEVRDAITLVNGEEQAQGNDIERLSIDGIGFHGETLRELADPEGLNIHVFTPPREFNTSKGFDSSQFEPVDQGTRLKCPAGKVSGVVSRKPDKPNTGFYVFPRPACSSCPLLSACAPNFNADGKAGRRVSKNEYEKEYATARAVAQTEAYAEVRQKHPAIERKLNEFARHHATRRTKHRGRERVLIEQLMTAVAINMKRMLKLLRGQYAPIALASAY